MVRVEAAGATAASGDHVLAAGRTGVTLDGVPSPAQVAGDGTKPHALAQQAVDQRMVGRIRSARRPVGRAGGSFVSVCARLASMSTSAGLVVRLRVDRAQAVAMRGDALLDRLAQVLEHMEPVGDLQCARRAERSALGVGAGPIPADHLSPGMVSQADRRPGFARLSWDEDEEAWHEAAWDPRLAPAAAVRLQPRVVDLPARASQEGRFWGPDLVGSAAGDRTGTRMRCHRMRWVSQNGPRSSSVAACAAFLKAAVVETPYQ